MTDFDGLIDELADAAVPVRRQSVRHGRLVLGGLAVATVALVYLTFGFRADIMAAEPAPIQAIAAGLMAILAIAAGASAVRMARPQVGAPGSGATWALAALLLLPTVALVGIAARPERIAGLALAEGLRCLTFGLVAGLGTLAFLVAWLRRGAPVAPGRAAWLAGLAAGAIGAVAVTLECPEGSLAHLGVWHAAVPFAAGGLASLLLPRFLRW